MCIVSINVVGKRYEHNALGTNAWTFCNNQDYAYSRMNYEAISIEPDHPMQYTNISELSEES